MVGLIKKKVQRASGLSVAIKATMKAEIGGFEPVEAFHQFSFTTKLANCIQEREEVFRLAYQVYRDKGYILENENAWLVNSYDANPSTLILIVKDSSHRVVASVTLVFRDQGKLPAERIYKNEIYSYLKQGEKLLEISRLVINKDYRNSKEILTLLFNYICVCAFHINHCDGMIVQVNPKHKNYYMKLLRFEEIGSEKCCPSVQNAPAVLLYANSKVYFDGIQKRSMLQNQIKDRTLYSCFLSLENAELVAGYLKKQNSQLLYEEKQYFGLVEENEETTLCAF